jgi:hypothetical protein
MPIGVGSFPEQAYSFLQTIILLLLPFFIFLMLLCTMVKEYKKNLLIK